MTTASLDQVTVVLPTLNEEEGVGLVIEELLATGFKPEQIMVVDGHSTDRTREVAAGYGVKVILQEGEGKADAIATAYKHVKTRYMLVIDADHTYPASQAPRLLERAEQEGYDEVIGARVYSQGSQSAVYRLGNRLLTALFNLLFGTNLSDVLSGMYLVRTSALNGIAWETSGFSVESEIAAHIASQTGRITEVPVQYRPRRGEKKLCVRHGLQIARDMIRLTWRYNPVFFIFILGSLLLVPGLLLGAYVAYHYFFTGVKYYVKGLIALMLTLSGFQSLILAVLALYMKRVEYRINRKLAELAESS